MFLLLPLLLALVPLYSRFPRACCATIERATRSYPSSSSSSLSSSYSQSLFSLAQEALTKPSLCAHLSPENLSILRALVKKKSHCSVKALIQCIYKSNSYQHIHLGKHDHVFWRILAEDAFYRLAQIDSAQAEKLVDDVILPDHPFYKELLDHLKTSKSSKGYFKTSQFFKDSHLKLGTFFDHIIAPQFNATFRELLDNAYNSSAQAGFKKLLKKYRETVSWKYGPEKHACTFLSNLGLNYAQTWAAMLGKEYEFYLNVTDFAAIVYQEILSIGSPKDAKQAQKTLEKICTVTEGKSYDEIMSECLVRAQEPTDMQKLQEYIREAHRIPQIYSSISYHTRSILEVFLNDSLAVSAVCDGFLEYVCTRVAHNRSLLHKDTYGYWDSLIQSSFERFIQDRPQEARAILNKVIIPGGPPLIHDYPGLANNAAQLFVHNDPSEYRLFTESSCELCFRESFSEILANTNPKEAQLQFTILMHRYKQAMSYKNPGHKYHFTFLLNAGLEAFRLATTLRHDGYAPFFSCPDLFAAHVYDVIASKSPSLAQDLLRSVLPDVHGKATDGSYLAVIGTYLESGAQPMDVEHLRGLVEEALQITTLSPQYQSCLKALQRESYPHEAFLCYIFYNYRLDKIEAPKNGALFWCSLLYSSVSKFAQEHPRQAQEFLDQVIPARDNQNKEQSLEKRCSVFAADLFGTIPLKWVIENGHAATVKYLIGRGQLDASLESQGTCIEASDSWDAKVFNHLFKGGFGYDSNAISYAFNKAVRGGNAQIFSAIASSGVMIPILARHLAVNRATQCDNIATLKTLLKEGSPTLNPHEFALGVAVENGKLPVATLLLSHGGILSTYCKDYLFEQIIGGQLITLLETLAVKGIFPSSYAIYMTILDAILARRNGIATYLMSSNTLRDAANDSTGFSQKSKDYIFSQAALHGDAESLSYLMGSCSFTETVKDHALIAAASGGRTEIVKRLIQSGVSLSAQDCALVEAAQGGRTETVTFLIESGNSFSNYAKKVAINSATKNGHTSTFSHLTSDGTFFFECPLDDELYEASIRGQAEDVERLLGSGKYSTISAYARDQAFLQAVERNHSETVQCFLSRHATLTGYAKDLALQAVTKSGNADMLKCLWDSGAASNASLRDDVFLVAIADGHTAHFENLLKFGFVFSENSKNLALELASYTGNRHILALLIGSHFAFSEFAKGQALFGAATKRHRECLRYLITSGLTFSTHAKSRAAKALVDDQNIADLQFFVEYGEIESVSLVDAISMHKDGESQAVAYVLNVLRLRGEAS